MSVDGILISGLDTFSGTPSSGDYLPIDDGSGTKKIAVPDLLSYAESYTFTDPNDDGNVVISKL